MSLAGSYLDRDGLKALSLAPSGLIDGDWIDPTGQWTDAEKLARRTAWYAYIDARLVFRTSRINDQLRKRYVVPFEEPVPAIVRGWLADLVTPEIWGKRGWDAEDEHAQWVMARALESKEDLDRAANSETGLFELPVRDTADEPAVTKGGPLTYSEASPYTWTDDQIDRVRG